MVSTRCFCSILIKFGFCWQIWLEVSNFKFHENLSSGSRVDACGRIRRDRQKALTASMIMRVVVISYRRFGTTCGFLALEYGTGRLSATLVCLCLCLICFLAFCVWRQKLCIQNLSMCYISFSCCCIYFVAVGNYLHEVWRCRNRVFDKERTNEATMYEGWNFNSSNYLFTTDTK